MAVSKNHDIQSRESSNSQKASGTFQASGTSSTLYESRVISVSNSPGKSAYKMMSKINNHSNPMIKYETIQKNNGKKFQIHTSICLCTALGLFFGLLGNLPTSTAKSSSSSSFDSETNNAVRFFSFFFITALVEDEPNSGFLSS